MNIETRLRGMLHGVALGDALGAPWEFLTRDNGAGFAPPVDHFPEPDAGATLLPCKWGPYHGHGAVGQVTDDTEMTIALADALVAGPVHNWADRAVENYILWANSGGRMIGRNTGALFRGIKAATPARRRATYQKRWQRRAGTPDLAVRSQSNGCLMRAAPLAVLADPAECLRDCGLTNPHPVCFEACRFYHRWLREVIITGAHPRGVATAALATFGETLPGIAENFLVAVLADASRQVAEVVREGLRVTACAGRRAGCWWGSRGPLPPAPGGQTSSFPRSCEMWCAGGRHGHQCSHRRGRGWRLCRRLLFSTSRRRPRLRHIPGTAPSAPAIQCGTLGKPGYPVGRSLAAHLGGGRRSSRQIKGRGAWASAGAAASGIKTNGEPHQRQARATRGM